MKKVILLSLFALLASSFSCKTTKRTDSVGKAETANENKAKKDILDAAVAEFLVKIADACLMDIQEGKDAEQKATFPDLKHYGTLMIRDHGILLDKIKQLASSRHITLPTEISADKQEGLKEQSGKEGLDFDEKFIKMMTIDHKRDLHDFKKAETLDDTEIKIFATEYQPVIQSHLDKLELIRKEMK